MEDLRLDQVILHPQLPAQLCHRAEIHLLGAWVDGDGVELKGGGVELPELCHGVQQHQGVLAAGHPHGDPIPRLNHVVVLHAPAHMG